MLALKRIYHLPIHVIVETFSTALIYEYLDQRLTECVASYSTFEELEIHCTKKLSLHCSLPPHLSCNFCSIVKTTIEFLSGLFL